MFKSFFTPYVRRSKLEYVTPNGSY